MSATTTRGSRCSTRISRAPAARPPATGSSATRPIRMRSSSRPSSTRPRKRSPPASAVDGLVEAGGAPSKERRREEIVARYWQRYCSKNDTIGFFGPLAWGELRDDGPALTQHSRGLVSERTVHIETWCLERFLQT